MPGTGKTATVLEAARKLQGDRLTCTTPFLFAHVNAMCLSTPGAVFAEICRKVPSAAPRGARASEAKAHAALTRFFTVAGDRREVVVLLIDEVDYLVTQAQTVLYRLFDWLSLPRARLAIVAIANTMDLPERLLPRVASRLGIRRVSFAPYDRSQLRAILADRLRLCRAATAFSEDALTLCAARIAAGSGDARKALQVCRKALEGRLRSARARGTAEARGGDEFEDGGGPVSVSELAAAEADLLRANPAARAITGLAIKARRVLLAVVLELRRRPGATAVFVRDVVRRYEVLNTMAEREDVEEKEAVPPAPSAPSAMREQATPRKRPRTEGDAAAEAMSPEKLEVPGRAPTVAPGSPVKCPDAGDPAPAADADGRPGDGSGGAAGAGGAAVVAAGPVEDGVSRLRHADDAAFCLRRLHAMAILQCDPAALAGAHAADAAPAVQLGESLDADDVADALMSRADDILAKELLSEAASGPLIMAPLRRASD